MDEQVTQDESTVATPEKDGRAHCSRAHRRCGRRARWVVLVLLIAAALVAWRVWAHSPLHAMYGLAHDTGNPARYHADATEFADRLVGRLEMPATQREQAQKIVIDAADDLQPLLQAHREARVSLYHALTADTIDPAQLETLRVDEIKRADLASQRLVQAVGALGQLVSPAQRRTLLEHWRPEAG